MITSPIWGHAPSEPIITKFGVRVLVADIITDDKFCRDRLKGFRSVGVQKWGSSIDLDSCPYNRSHYHAACDTSPKQKPEVDFRRCGRHLEYRYDFISRPPMVRFLWNLVCQRRFTCQWWWKHQSVSASKISIFQPFVSETGNSKISAAHWATLSKFVCKMQIVILHPRGNWKYTVSQKSSHLLTLCNFVKS